MKRQADYARGIGSIISNLLSLELLLRLFLHDTVGPTDPHLSFESISVGDVVPETPLTSFDSLGQLIVKVNREFRSRGLTDPIDETLVQLRNALAHGRILAAQPHGPFRLFKFSQASAGGVQVTTVVDLTPEWREVQIKRTSSEIAKLMTVGHSLGLPSFPEQE